MPQNRNANKALTSVDRVESAVQSALVCGLLALLAYLAGAIFCYGVVGLAGKQPSDFTLGWIAGCMTVAAVSGYYSND